MKNQVEIFFLIMQACLAEILNSLQAKEGNILNLWVCSAGVTFILLYSEVKTLKGEMFQQHLFFIAYRMNNGDYVDGKG